MSLSQPKNHTYLVGEVLFPIPQNVVDSHNYIEVLWPDDTKQELDLFAILIDKQCNLIEDGDLVYYNSCNTIPNSKIPMSVDGAVYGIGDPLDDEDGYWGEGMFIDLYKTRLEVNRIDFFIAAYDVDGKQTLKGIKDIKMRFRSHASEGLFYETIFEGPFDKEKVISLCSLFRKENGQWCMKIEDIRYSNNLSYFLDRYVPSNSLE